MYTDREKAFYVEKMWSEGLRPATAARRWGTPSRFSLANWEKQALAGALDAVRPRPHGSCEHAKHARYPRETKDEALRLASLGKPSGEIARMLGVRPGAVGAWVREARRGAGAARGGAPGGKAARGGGDGRAGAGAGRGCGRIPRGGRPKEGAARGGKDGRVRTDEEYDALLARLEEAEATIDAYKAVVLDPKVADLANRPNRWKAEFGERLRREFGLRLAAVLSLLQISKSTYEYNRARLGGPERGSDQDIADDVADAFGVAGKGARGYRFVHAELRRRGIVCSEKRVRRVMRARGLVPRSVRRPKRYSSYEGEVDGGAPNLLLDDRKRHNFRRDRPFELLLTDVSEFSIPAGKLYLSPMMDCLDGALVSWAESEHPDGALADAMLGGALAQLPEGPGERLIHSDRGGLYRREAWRTACEEAGVTRSMSRLGCSPDNSRMEGFFGLMKQEMFYGVDWSLASLDDLRQAIGEYIESYNGERLKSFHEKGPGPRGGKKGRVVYETINERRERLGFPPAIAVKCDPTAA